MRQPPSGADTMRVCAPVPSAWGQVQRHDSTSLQLGSVLEQRGRYHDAREVWARHSLKKESKQEKKRGVPLEKSVEATCSNWAARAAISFSVGVFPLGRTGNTAHHPVNRPLPPSPLLLPPTAPRATL